MLCIMQGKHFSLSPLEKYRFYAAAAMCEDNGNSTERRYTWLLSLHSTFSIRFEERSFSFFIFLFYFCKGKQASRALLRRGKGGKMNRFFLITLFVSFLSSFMLGEREWEREKRTTAWGSDVLPPARCHPSIQYYIQATHSAENRIGVSERALLYYVHLVLLPMENFSSQLARGRGCCCSKEKFFLSQFSFTDIFHISRLDPETIIYKHESTVDTLDINHYFASRTCYALHNFNTSSFYWTLIGIFVFFYRDANFPLLSLIFYDPPEYRAWRKVKVYAMKIFIFDEREK